MLFIFDNQCSPRLAEGLRILEEGNTLSSIPCTVTHIKDLIPANSSDALVIETAGKNDGVIITYDRDFKDIKNHGQLYAQYKVGVVYFRSYKNVLRYWDLVLSFVNHWEDLKSMVNSTTKPFIIEVTLKGLSIKQI
jgi:predicted nuclease of predicted toxin-antitoxin system